MLEMSLRAWRTALGRCEQLGSAEWLLKEALQLDTVEAGGESRSRHLEGKRCDGALPWQQLTVGRSGVCEVVRSFPAQRDPSRDKESGAGIFIRRPSCGFHREFHSFLCAGAEDRSARDPSLGTIKVKAAWRGCIDNIPACEAQSVPWGAQQRVDEESPDALLAPQLDTAAEEAIRTHHSKVLIQPAEVQTGAHTCRLLSILLGGQMGEKVEEKDTEQSVGRGRGEGRLERSGRNSAAPLLGEIFLDSTPGSERQTVSLCSRLFARGHGGGWRASRSRPAPPLLTERGTERGTDGGRQGGGVKREEERAAGYTLSFLRRVTGQRCSLSTGASAVKCDITPRVTQIALELLQAAQRSSSIPGLLRSEFGWKWPILAAKRLRERGMAEEMRPKLDEGHFTMNWEVTGSTYLDRQTDRQTGESEGRRD
ncbi:unnamed protein product [Pleuronectes platessa]|uniref:Uncharacterized protein n=1 Tax=Pleuronectes platessa TaxID=8262 RepID=A0A9N7VHX5_PLEPL|nr:unnamed protein product [Pleuronectes platessa]